MGIFSLSTRRWRRSEHWADIHSRNSPGMMGGRASSHFTDVMVDLKELALEPGYPDVTAGDGTSADLFPSDPIIPVRRVFPKSSSLT